MNWKRHIFALSLILFFALYPILSLLTASLIMNMFECTGDEGNVNPCIVFGVDIGETLYHMSVIAWLAMITVPIGGVVLLIYLISLVFIYRSHKTRGF